ncbi:unnamed protein product [Closterium sp. Naga37s-1]|nr:unnamed protein product [Closterium sp. Naga37s-1]
MPPRAIPVKHVNKMDPAAAAAVSAATLKTLIAGPSSRPTSATAVPSKSSRTLFAEDDSESWTLSAKLAAFRIKQAAGKTDNGKGKEHADFKDAVSDAGDENVADDEDGDLPGVARRVSFLDDEDDGLLAHDPKECFEEKAKEDLAAKLRFPLTLLIPSDHLQEISRTQATVKGLLGMWENDHTENAVKTICLPPVRAAAATVATATTGIILKDPALVLVSMAGNREEWVCLLECCEKGKGSSFEQATHHVLSQRHRGGFAKQGAATCALKDKLNLRVLRKEFGIQ